MISESSEESSGSDQELLPAEPSPPQDKTNKSSTIRKYMDKLGYNSSWKRKHTWMDYDQIQKGMICTICKVYGKVPVQAKGAWVTRPVKNWVKATALLVKHEKSDWHRAAVEKQAMAQHGDVADLIIAATDQERRENRDLMKKIVRSLYFLIKHHIPHTTVFEDLITLQIENGDVILKSHREKCARNAKYESYTTVVELLASISKMLEDDLLNSLKASPYYSLMADESTDVSSLEELSVCARWLDLTENKPVEHFLGIVHAKEINAEAITGYLTTFLHSRNIGFEKMRGLGFDGTNTMSGHRSGVQTRLKVHAPSAVYVHCRCHKLQLAALNAATEHNEVKIKVRRRIEATTGFRVPREPMYRRPERVARGRLFRLPRRSKSRSCR